MSPHSSQEEKIRIGFDAKRAFLNHTGLGNYSRTLLCSLAEQPQYSYRLYTPKASKDSEIFPELERFQVQTPSNRYREFLWRRRGILRDLEKDRVRLFHGLSNELPWGISKTKIKSVVSIHDLIFRIFPKTYPFFDRSVFHYKTAQALRESDRVIAISEKTKQDLCEYYATDSKKITVVHQACNEVFYRDTGESPEDRERFLKRMKLPNQYFLYVGSIEERKNLLNIAEAILQIPASRRIPLVILGKGKAYKQRVLEKIAKSGAEKDFIWLQNPYNVLELKKLYAYSSLLLYLSVYEGFGIPVLESVLSKTPVLTSENSAMSEITGEHGFYANPDRVDQIAQKAEEILSDTQKSRLQTQAAYQNAMRAFSPKAAAQKVLQIYEELLS